MCKLLMRGKNLKSFEHYLNANKKIINTICLSIDLTTDNRIEYDDLYQEAVLKLFENYVGEKPLNINFTRKCIRNHLINYVKKNIKDKLVNYDIDDFLYSSGDEEQYEE